MKKGIIIVVSVFLILVGTFVVLYFFYYDPNPNDKATHVDISIEALKDEKKITTGYVIIYNNIVKYGNTSNLGATLEKVPINVSTRIHNKNLESQSFYADIHKFKTSEIKPYRVQLDLKEAKPVNISLIEHKNQTIKLNIFSEYFQEVKVCIKYSTHVVYAKLQNFSQIDKPEFFKYQDKCYDLGTTLENSDVNLIIDYKTFGEIDEDDFIKILIIDSDYRNGNLIITENQEDIGGENIEFIVRFIY